MANSSKLKMSQPVFILGSPRSGTTWLYHLLCSSGGFAIFRGESSAFNIFGPRYGHFRTPELRDEFLRECLPSEYFLRTGLPPEVFSRRVREQVRSTGDFLRVLMESIAESQGAERWAECSPPFALYVREILAAFPGARFLHIVRDGRDVALSLSQLRWVAPLPWHRDFEALTSAMYWEWINERALVARDLAPSQYLQVRYERLVQKTPEALAEIGSFIQHDLDFDRIRKFAIGAAFKPNTSFEKDSEGGAFNPVDRWRRGYSPAQLQRVEALIGDALRGFGYALAAPAGTLAPLMVDRLSRHLYRLDFEARIFLRTLLPFARRRIQLPPTPPLGDEDPTLRPAENLRLIRALVDQDYNAFRNAGTGLGRSP